MYSLVITWSALSHSVLWAWVFSLTLIHNKQLPDPEGSHCQTSRMRSRVSPLISNAPCDITHLCPVVHHRRKGWMDASLFGPRQLIVIIGCWIVDMSDDFGVWILSQVKWWWLMLLPYSNMIISWLPVVTGGVCMFSMNVTLNGCLTIYVALSLTDQMFGPICNYLYPCL